MDLFKYSINFFEEVITLKKSEVLLVCGDDDRSFDFDGIKYSPILDSLNEILIAEEIHTITIAYPISKIYGRKAFGNVVSVNAIFSLNLIFYKFLSFFSKKSNYNIVSNQYFWNYILSKVQPSIIIGIQPPPELCFIAKKNGVKVYDIQHGVISPEGYYSFNYFQSKYRYNFELPDMVLCWNISSSKRIKKYFNDRVETIITGNLWFRKFNQLDKSKYFIKYFIDKISLIKKTEFTVLVTLQWDFKYIENDYSIVIDRSLLNYIKKNSQNYNWWIKLHPMQMKDNTRMQYFGKLETIFKDLVNVDFEICSSLPLPLLLRNVDAHITSHSAVTFEASWLGVNTALMYKNIELLNEYFCEQINSGIAEIIDCSESGIEGWLNKIKHLRITKRIDFNNYNENIELLINTIKYHVSKN